MRFFFVYVGIALASVSSLAANDLFRSVQVGNDTWEIVFHEKGGRYRIEIDSVDRGTSGYLQRLRLLASEKLKLIDKHWHLEVRPSSRGGKRGVEITKVYRDRFTGELKRVTSFQGMQK